MRIIKLSKIMLAMTQKIIFMTDRNDSNSLINIYAHESKINVKLHQTYINIGHIIILTKMQCIDTKY